MATITVTNNLDSGVGSLRSALAQAAASAGDDQIVFGGSLAGGGVITLQSALNLAFDAAVYGAISINGDTDGDGDADITVSGDIDGDGAPDPDEGRLLYVGAAANISLTGVNLTGGNEFQGSALNSYGAVSISNATISNNYSSSGVAATTIYNRSGATMSLDNVLFENNTSVANAPGVVASGLRNAGTLTITDSGVIGGAGTGNGETNTQGIFNTGTVNGPGILGTGASGALSGGVISALAVTNSGAGTTDSALKTGVSGGSGGDSINSGVFTTAAPQNILGFGGDDTITGAFGADSLVGGDGDDIVGGSAGDDTLSGGSGADTLLGGGGGDLINGGQGDDGINGDGGDSGVAALNFALFDTDGPISSLNAIPTTLTASGVVGDFDVAALAQAVGIAPDTFAVRYDGSISVAGGAYTFSRRSDDGSRITIDGVVVVDQPNPDNAFLTTSGSVNLSPGTHTIEILYFEAGGGESLNVNVAGPGISGAPSLFNAGILQPVAGSSDGDDSLNGGAGDDTVSGAGGADSILGGAGDDSLSGGTGADTLAGEEGINFVDGGADSDQIRFAGAFADYTLSLSGTDVVVADGDETTTVRNVESFVFSDVTRTAADMTDSAVPPTLSGDFAISVVTGGQTTITAADLSVSEAATFQLSAVTGGIVALASAPTTGVASFTSAQLDAGQVLFQNIGGASSAGFTVSAVDGAGASSAAQAIAVVVTASPSTPTSGDDSLTGTNGDDAIDALAGSDTVDGLGGDDRLTGSRGADVLFGRSGADTLIGNGGRDQLFGNGGADSLSGGGGRDLVNGGGGRDTIDGGGGSDTITGRGGRDEIDGGGGRDEINGGGGNDVISGGRGADALTGGRGSDEFSFKTGDFLATITDFEQGRDKIRITDGAESFDDLSISQVGDDVLIRFSNVRVVVQDDNAGAFNGTDFLF